MSTLKTWLKTLKDHDMRAYNRVSSRDLALCINFLQIPDTDVIAVTVTVMKNKTKKNSLPPDKFVKIMNCLEDKLQESLIEYSKIETIDSDDANDIFFSPTRDLINNQWYIQLCCHRVFFIPEKGLWSTIKNLFIQHNLQYMTACGLSEVAVMVNTEQYDCNIKFY